MGTTRVFVNQQLYPGEFLLHKKYASSELLFDLVWTHGNIVADIAVSLLDSGKFDTTGLQREYIIQAGLLMDIGVYLCDGYEWMPGQDPTGRPYIQHGIVGAWILEQESYSPEIIQVAYAHSGVGVTAADVRNFGLQLPEADYIPHTPLQLLMTYAGKFHSKTPAFKDTTTILESLKKYGPDKARRFQELENQFGRPNLEPIIQKYQAWHHGFQHQIEQVQQAGSSMDTTNQLLNSAGIAQTNTSINQTATQPQPTALPADGMLDIEVSDSQPGQ